MEPQGGGYLCVSDDGQRGSGSSFACASSAVSERPSVVPQAVKNDHVEHTDKVEVRAILTSTGRENAALEQIVSRLSLGSDVSGVSWEILTVHD
jgi:uncharacterized membrane protein YhiD involved in acid resistance